MESMDARVSQELRAAGAFLGLESEFAFLGLRVAFVVHDPDNVC